MAIGFKPVGGESSLTDGLSCGASQTGRSAVGGEDGMAVGYADQPQPEAHIIRQSNAV
jgi:hypothetical protein